MLAASSCPGAWCFSQSEELIPCLIDRNALQVPVESAESVFSRQSVITQRELGQDIKVIYSLGMNPLSFYTKEDQRHRGIKDFQILCSTGCP